MRGASVPISGSFYEVNQGTRLGITYTSPVKLDFSAQP